MFHKTPGLAVVVVAFLILGLGGLDGCVAQSDYLRKQAEADALNRDRAALTAQNSDFKAQIEKLTAATEGLIADKDRLIVDTERLEKERTDLDARLNRITEETSRTIEELRNRNIELEGDKQMLAESISLLKKTKEVEVRTVSKTYEDLLSEMKGEIAQGQIAITELQGKLTVDVVDKILFDSGQTEIRPEGLDVLKRVVEILITVTDKVIRVEGHTDSIPIAGALAKRYPTNWELSAARALNVTRYLEKEGIDPTLLSAVAFGEHQPIAENDTPEGRAKNRRIAIILLPKE
ncbi:MAG: chemotaxis protein MotB [Syntrophobacterales bacterium CG_4_8_14_3_um_filter_58_8]|nr:MAG: chemotaxis protein MotB [Syntrophobacterales bacterium CG03_land_8_20_14_0_80_58_14]PJC75223.1 MAG: chemotaxis protein MotB [Syntrophobacterales bacterium CG_4_8_14_3_um_filter_58_8]